MSRVQDIPSSSVHCGAIGASSRLFAVGEDGAVQLWSLGATSAVHTLRGHSTPVTAVALSQREDHLLSGSSAGTMRLWDATTGTSLRSLRHPKAADAPAPASTSSLLLSRLCFHPRGDYFATGGANGLIGVFDMRQRQGCLHTYCTTDSAGVTALTFSPDGRWVVAGDAAGHVRAWDLTSGQEAAVASLPSAIVSLAFDPIADPSPLPPLSTSLSSALGPALSTVGNRLLATCRDLCTVYDASLTRELARHPAGGLCAWRRGQPLTVSPEGLRLSIGKLKMAEWDEALELGVAADGAVLLLDRRKERAGVAVWCVRTEEVDALLVEEEAEKKEKKGTEGHKKNVSETRKEGDSDRGDVFKRSMRKKGAAMEMEAPRKAVRPKRTSIMPQSPVSKGREREERKDEGVVPVAKPLFDSKNDKKDVDSEISPAKEDGKKITQDIIVVSPSVSVFPSITTSSSASTASSATVTTSTSSSSSSLTASSHPTDPSPPTDLASHFLPPPSLTPPTITPTHSATLSALSLRLSHLHLARASLTTSPDPDPSESENPSNPNPNPNPNFSAAKRAAAALFNTLLRLRDPAVSIDVLHHYLLGDPEVTGAVVAAALGLVKGCLGCEWGSAYAERAVEIVRVLLEWVGRGEGGKNEEKCYKEWAEMEGVVRGLEVAGVREVVRLGETVWNKENRK